MQPEGWWRCSDYEIVGGTHIAPVRGAEIERYDPFDQHDEFWKKRKKDRRGPSYVDLIDLDLGDEDALLEWVGQNGLLGILPHRMEETHLWPRWGRSEPMREKGKTVYCATQTQYRVGFPTKPIKAYNIQPKEPREPGTPLTPEEVDAALGQRAKFFPPIRPPGVTVLDVEMGGTEWAGIPEALGVFFPRVDGVTDFVMKEGRKGRNLKTPSIGSEDPRLKGPTAKRLEGLEYPLPFSDEFCLEYGEPLDLFRNHIWHLRHIIRDWDGDEVEERLPATADPAWVGMAALRGLHPAFKPSAEGGWRWGWNSRSLYAAFSLMILEDFPLKGARLVHCGKCKKPFTTTDPRKEYCCTKCLKAEQKRRKRKKVREEREEMLKKIKEMTEGSAK